MYRELTRVVDEARVTVHRLSAVVELLHEGSGVSVPMRAVLEFLRGRGPHTVPAVARARGVTRQHIQTIVNDLLAVGLAERLTNPNHRRAPLIGLTDAGREAIDALHARERGALEPIMAEREGLTVERLTIAADVLRAIGDAAHQLTEEEDERWDRSST